MLREWLIQTFPSLEPYSRNITITFFAVGFVLLIFFMNYRRPPKK